MANSAHLSAPEKPKIWTIPAGANFLGELARGLAADNNLRHDRAALSEAIIYVPNRRSARALSLALLDAAGGGVLLAPDIRALGDLESDEGAPVAEVALSGLAPMLTPGERIGAMAQLVHAYYRSAYATELMPASALATARDLLRLLDQAALSPHADWSRLPELVTPADLSVHWQQSSQFLSIVADAWPRILAERGAIDPFQRRLAAAEALAAQWAEAPPQAPVVIAGSTGATPAGRVIMRAALSLPHGMIVLPGLDTDLDEAAQTEIAASVGHPQHALFRTLNMLEVPAASVCIWPGVKTHASGDARRRLIHEALAPADATADWLDKLTELAAASGCSIPDFARQALRGITVFDAANEGAEAEAAALLLRETLQTPGKTAALVTPDAGLARRVAALLRRWGIQVNPSAGEPLQHTAAGSLITLCARWVLDPAAPLIMMSVLKHSSVVQREGLAPLELHFLRGPRVWQSFAELRTSIEQRHTLLTRPPFSPEQQAASSALVASISTLFVDTRSDFSELDMLDGREATARIAALAAALCTAPWPLAGEDGRAAARLLEHVAEISDALGPMPPAALAELIEAEAARITVYSDDDNHPRLAIWGPLEARLQTAGRLILAGLNEDVWPEHSPADAFLPRRFRSALGLNDPDDRLGLSAHDFAQLAAAPEVFLLYANRRNDAPAVASRWVWRLRTLVEGALVEGAAEALRSDAPIADWIAAIEQRGTGTLPPAFTAQPRPTRCPAHWPSALSVTRVDTLQRDPYALWAENVLGLAEVAPFSNVIDVRERGSAVHKALELFEDSDGSSEALVQLLAEWLARYGERPAAWAAREAVWRKTANWFVAWRADRGALTRVKLEVPGAINLVIDGAPFRLSAVADRIETRPDGACFIVDYKTGTPPTDREIAASLSQQMPLQALIMREGGFTALPKVDVAALEYVAFKANACASIVGAKADITPAKLTDAAAAGLTTLITSYRQPGAVFLSAPRVQFIKYESGYVRLARRAEWTIDIVEGGDAG
jgi:ATP-dependent helicase/nuclease subunit B